MKIFAELGALLEKRWRERNFDETVFPALAAAALREVDPATQISVWDVAAWAMREPVLPAQRDLAGSFGEPPVTLFDSSRFHIDVYFWLQSTTAIHQHGFCGAFQVSHGGSLHSSYRFAQRERINFHCALGDLTLDRTEWLQVGAIKEIRGGSAFIHALFHLENPSATIVVRTNGLPLALPQFSYHKPFLALDPFFDDATFVKKRQFVGMLLNTRRPDADKLITELLENSDFHSAAEMLRFLQSILRNDGGGGGDAASQQNIRQNERFEHYLATTQQKFPQWAGILPAVFAEQQREFEIQRRRNFVTDANHRFFLALLLNVPDKKQILELVGERASEQNPLETILDWFDELGRTRISGTTENALGIADFNDQYSFVLEKMLDGKSLEEIEREISAEFSPAQAAEVKHQHETLQSSPLFSALWLTE